MTDKDAAGMQLIGVEIGSYRITDQLGSGGMGAVFRATHKSHNLRAAIKVMLPPGQLADQPTAIRRFLEEARALSEVEHSSLVKLHDVGTLPDGKIYMQMELLQGETLDARLKRLGGPLPLGSAVELARQMASALHVVHERGIVHRDVKPHNVIVVADREAPGQERAKLLDFGIAKFLGGSAEVTATNRPLGTPRYMSPEQCESSSLINERTDVYSLGLLLFEMVTGESPYPLEAGEALSWLYAHVERRPRTLRQLRPEASAELEALVSAMLDKLPRQRPAMSEVESQLRQCSQQLGGQSSSSAPLAQRQSPPPAEIVAVPSAAPASLVRRRRLLWGAIGSLGLLGVGTALLGLTHSAHENGTWWQSLTARRVLRSAPSQGEAADVDAAVAAARAPTGIAFIPGQVLVMGSTTEESEAAYQECVKIAKDCEREEFARELPQRAVTLHSFYLDKNEVTNRQFADWLNRPLVQPSIREGRMVHGRNDILLADLHPAYGGIEFVGGKYQPRTGFEDLPVAQITWYGARQYCETLGKSLPTEAQWEAAAHGLTSLPGALRSRWPWGSEPPRCDGVVVARVDNGACKRPNPGPDPVGRAPQDVTPQGVHDLGGNVREWVLDVFAVPYPDCGPCRDPVVQAVHPGVQGSGYRVVRGGNWVQNPLRARSVARSRNDESGASPSIGFRCAASVVR